MNNELKIRRGLHICIGLFGVIYGSVILAEGNAQEGMYKTAENAGASRKVLTEMEIQAADMYDKQIAGGIFIACGIMSIASLGLLYDKKR
jgi:hypothetical protein